nr:helitron helicase-like domain-containing protein [Tanacetum cinerariifolium]
NFKSDYLNEYPFIAIFVYLCHLMKGKRMRLPLDRMRHFRGTDSGNLEEVIVQGLINFLDEHNELVSLFRTTRDKCAGQFVPDFKRRLYSVVGAWEYDLSTSKTLGGIVFQNSQDIKTDYDVIIQSRGGPPQRINKLYPSHYIDSLAICRALGNPHFFTFTCNVNWPEIKRHMQHYPDVFPDRADVAVRVFHQKVQHFCKFLKDRRLFGTVTWLLYMIEFQKRGLPHCHMLIWIDEKDKIQCAEDIDRYISAELPDPIEDPEGYKIISEMMIHGPCGPHEPTAPCMKENNCSKKFLKRYNDTTYFDKDGFKDMEPSAMCKSRIIGGLAHVHPSAGELYYLRILLCHHKGCKSYEDIKTVNRRVYLTFRAACQALGLLGDDKEWDTALMEACFSKKYNRDELAQETNDLVPKLNVDQRKTYDLIVNAVSTGQQEPIFVYGHGVASSGIASLLLPNGRTTHSRFKLPLELTDESIYRTLKDIMDSPEKLFSGKTIVLGGDLRQTLPVKKGASKLEIIASSIAESHLWNHFKASKRSRIPGQNKTPGPWSARIPMWQLFKRLWVSTAAISVSTVSLEKRIVRSYEFTREFNSLGSVGDEYSKRNSTNRGPVILDFENSIVHLPCVMGASSGFEAVNTMDSSATKTKYPTNVSCPDISFFERQTPYTLMLIVGFGNLVTVALHIDFENQAVHLSSIVGISTGFQIGNDVEMSNGKNSNPLNIDHLVSPLLGDMNSLHSNGVSRNVESRRKNMGVESHYQMSPLKYCGAKFCYGERVQRSSTYQLPNYHKYCSGGKVRLRAERHPPQYIRQLFRNRRFMDHIRAYNQMFSMTSFGARVEDFINNGRSLYVFKISGEVYHWIGSLSPNEGDPPRFLQLYIYDTQNEVANRMHHFGGTGSGNLEEVIVQGLISFLDEHNELVRLFRTTRDKCAGQFVLDFKLRLYSVVGVREYDLPTSETLGGIVFQNSRDTETDYDVIIQGGRLFQQYVVGVYCCIEQNRMDYYRTHQSDIRKDYLAGEYNAISRGDREGRFIGSKIILPMSFTGGPRYMYSHYLDALAICRALGNPQLFVTFTCNVNWPEIKRHMQHYPDVFLGDRAHVVVRVFHQKVKHFCKFLKDRRLFGTVTGCNRQPAVQILYVHLENMQVVTFRYHQPLKVVANSEASKMTTLTEWFEYNKFNTEGHHLTYLDFPKYYVWYADSKIWTPRVGFLGDDKEWDTALTEACFLSTPTELRNLFVQLLIFCDVSDPTTLWRKYWQRMFDDIPLRVSKEHHIPNLYINDPELEQRLLEDLRNRELMEERSYKRDELAQETNNLVPKLNADGRKTIALLLLPNGHTLHSRFKLPPVLTDESICKITKNMHAGHLLAKTYLIIWDESPMNDRRCFKTLDRTLKDIMDSPEKLFGGKTVVLGGDFRQTLPVKKVPEIYCIPDDNNDLSNFIYDKDTLHHPTAQELQYKAMVCPRNDTADIINTEILKMVDGNSIIYKSSDKAVPLWNDKGATELLYPIEYLNTL